MVRDGDHRFRAATPGHQCEREFFIGNLLVRVHFVKKKRRATAPIPVNFGTEGGDPSGFLGRNRIIDTSTVRHRRLSGEEGNPNGSGVG